MRVLRRWFVVLSTLLLLCSNIQPAHADPHALFFTAIGQQQLFFNMLAALDQADYVETFNDRNQLTLQRQAAGLDPESHPVLRSTTTGLSNVVTRSVTLEGQDLWTAYRYFQLALETERRRATSELARKYCQHAIGIVGCDESNPSANQRNEALVGGDDPVAYEAQVVSNGVLAAFSSNAEGDQEKRKKLAKEPGNAEPYEYDEGIAATRDAIAQGDQKDQKSGFFESLLQGALSAWAKTNVITTIYDNIKILDGGVVTPKFTVGAPNSIQGSNTLSGPEYVQAWTGSVMALFQNNAAVQEAGLAAASRVEAAHKTDVDGLKSDKQIVAQANGDSLGRLGVQVRTPAEARAADINAIKQGTAFLDSNQTSAPSVGEQQIGDTELVDRGQGKNPPQDEQGALLNTNSPTTSQVAGATTSSEEGTGQVKGIFSDTLNEIFNFYDVDQEPVSPNANPVPAHNEEGLIAANDALDDSFATQAEVKSTVDNWTDNLWPTLCKALFFCSG